MRVLLPILLVPCLITEGQAPDASNQSPSAKDVRMRHALDDYKEGDLARARAKSEALHSEYPTDLPISMLLANTYIKMGRAPQAVDLLKPIEPGHEADMELEYSLAFAQIQSGTAEGIARMEKVARTTHSANAWLIAGAARLHKNEFAEAKANLDTAIELNPSLPGLYSLAGKVRHASGDPGAALPFFQVALRANPRDFDANLCIGMYKLEQGDYEGARPLLELASQLQPGDPLARFKLAKVQSNTGQYSEAEATLEQLEKTNPNWLDPHIELAQIYYKQHRPEDAKRERAIIEHIEAQEQQAGPINP
jgi:tetratricopeptide (TPR) repeat protein